MFNLIMKYSKHIYYVYIKTFCFFENAIVALICEGLIFFCLLESFLSKACKSIASKFICEEFVKGEDQILRMINLIVHR